MLLVRAALQHKYFRKLHRLFVRLSQARSLPSHPLKILHRINRASDKTMVDWQMSPELLKESLRRRNCTTDVMN